MEKLSRKTCKVQPAKFEVKDKQHHELFETVCAIHRKDSQLIEQLCSRGDAFGKENNVLQAAWEDVQERLHYDKIQANSGSCAIIICNM